MLEFFSCMYQLRLITHLLQGPAETLLLYISIVGTCFFSCIVLTFKSFANISFKVRQLFKGGNYSREETINYQEVLTAETIQGRKLFKGGNYSRKYGMQIVYCVSHHFKYSNSSAFSRRRDTNKLMKFVLQMNLPYFREQFPPLNSFLP